jgi:hypothetical protein
LYPVKKTKKVNLKTGGWIEKELRKVAREGKRWDKPLRQRIQPQTYKDKRSREGPRYQKECMTGDNLRPGVSSNPEGDGSGGRLVVGLQHSTFERYRKASLLNIGITPAGIG